MNPTRSEERRRESLRQVGALLERHEVLESLAHKEQGPRRDLLESLAHRQNLAELASRLKTIHPADLAAILESLPGDKRLLVWEQLGADKAANVLVELAPSVRDQLIARTGEARLLEALGTMDTDDLAYVSEFLPEVVREAAYRSLDQAQREAVAAQYAYPEDSVGYLMTRELVAVREGSTLGSALAELRRLRELPPQSDAVFVVDARNVLRGLLPLRTLVAQDPAVPVLEASAPEPVVFTTTDRARDAGTAFERYDLVSAPVIDERGKLVGRLTVDAVMDFQRRQSELEALKRAGLSGEEDLFAPVAAAARNRWAWLAINLLTASLASRVIGMFEQTIRELVALATLMPIVASIGGNTGNQTIALMIRGLALDKITTDSVRHLFRKEVLVSLLNGAVWGSLMGLLTLLLYRSPSLSAVMAAAVALNLLVSAVVGVAVPLMLQRAGRDPAQGASVLLTFTTDGMGFFIFLGLARAFLVR